jgi:hypothetical protein
VPYRLSECQWLEKVAPMAGRTGESAVMAQAVAQSRLGRMVSYDWTSDQGKRRRFNGQWAHAVVWSQASETCLQIRSIFRGKVIRAHLRGSSDFLRARVPTLTEVLHMNKSLTACTRGPGTARAVAFRPQNWS